VILIKRHLQKILRPTLEGLQRNGCDPDVHVVITGHTDNVGSQKSNQLLSLKRAQAVRNWLVQKGTLSSV